jgi:RNA polymerase sigma factor for flagellar operon FliA
MNRDELIASQMKTAYAIAHEVKGAMPTHVEVDELIGDALHGLVVAADAFDGERGFTFGNYARWRIRGFILDGLRRRDVVGRRKKTDADDPRLQPPLALDAALSAAESDGTLQEMLADPRNAMEEIENRDLLDWLLRRLPTRERSVVVSLLWGGISEADLGKQRGVSGSRISQIKGDALHRMRLDLIECGLDGARMLALVRKRTERRRKTRILSAAVGG